MAFWYGLKANMKANGSIIKCRALGSFGMRTAIFTMENGSEIWPTDRELTSMLMGRFTQGSGLMTNSMATVRSPGLMARVSKVTMTRVSNMAQGSTDGKTDPPLRVSGS